MSGILVVCAIVVACTRFAAHPDAADLTGTFPCGTATCAMGEICVQGETLGSNGGGSANPDEHYLCAAPPAGCSLAECAKDPAQSHSNLPMCPQCLVDLCQYGGFGGGFSGRTLFCGYTF